MRPICKVCKSYPCAVDNNKKSKKGFQTMCDGCIKRPYTRNKKDKCERCGFVPEHRCQLDVDHIDGDHKNNDPSNLQTICANCHRLKSHFDRLAKLQRSSKRPPPTPHPTLFDFTV